MFFIVVQQLRYYIISMKQLQHGTLPISFQKLVLWVAWSIWNLKLCRNETHNYTATP
jgi:hypothetical protein